MDSKQLYDNKTISILLITASLVLLGNGIYSVQVFALNEGYGVAASLQASAYNTTIIPVFQWVAGQVGLLQQTVLESYFLAGIGALMALLAFTLFIYGESRYEGFVHRYVPIHLTLAIVYVMILLIIHYTFATSFYSTHLYLTYLAIGICVVFDLYLEYRMRSPVTNRNTNRGISINPSTPYSNLVRLKEELFDTLVGEIQIVDKHFNSAALANLSRLIPSDTSRVKSFTVITSAEMLDSNFGNNYRDLKSELQNLGIPFEVKLMSREDTGEQHERFVLDDNVAYKIPR